MNITLNIDEHSKIGRTFLKMVEAFANENHEVEIIDNNIAAEPQSPYNPKFVKMIKDAEKNGEYTRIDVNDVWGSLGLK